MLSLSQRENETIVIGEGDRRIEVMVIRIEGKWVRLGIAAPRDVPICRGELAEGWVHHGEKPHK